MEIKNNHRKWFWVKKIIYKFGGYKEKEILKNCKTMNLMEDDIIEVKSEVGTCFVYIPEYKEASCSICG